MEVALEFRGEGGSASGFGRGRGRGDRASPKWGVEREVDRGRWRSGGDGDWAVTEIGQ
ncbi:hypothetical protein TIFTF001_003874 [Ficus carica]|uniref:Uncharacterized protein n=1 Tax=Ficus carica TaxID=3494 RepID=A0AA88CV19_FICCA|nr:hypothetical protein TIFTF001_003874 [Ficus carica]